MYLLPSKYWRNLTLCINVFLGYLWPLTDGIGSFSFTGPSWFAWLPSWFRFILQNWRAVFCHLESTATLMLPFGVYCNPDAWDKLVRARASYAVTADSHCQTEPHPSIALFAEYHKMLGNRIKSLVILVYQRRCVVCRGSVLDMSATVNRNVGCACCRAVASCDETWGGIVEVICLPDCCLFDASLG